MLNPNLISPSRREKAPRVEQFQAVLLLALCGALRVDDVQVVQADLVVGAGQRTVSRKKTKLIK